MTSYAESPWSPDTGLNKGKDMHWGGGTLFVSDKEKKDDKTGRGRIMTMSLCIDLLTSLSLANTDLLHYAMYSLYLGLHIIISCYVDLKVNLLSDYGGEA